ADRPVLVDFWADWCAPCRMVAPIVETIAGDHADTLKVVKLDVDTNRQVPAKYGIMSIPTLMLFKDGQAVERVVGYVPKERLLTVLRRHLS
ncbi:MAG: thioredoxin, partial [Chloroflexi bacterium]|nr:thioredoxin [Chloroflexota bacterium]